MPLTKEWTESDVFPRGWYLAAYAGVGLLGGTASALLGIGSGVLIVPLLTGILGVPMRRAVAISIMTVLAASTLGVIVEEWRGTDIPWLLALVLAIGAQGGVWIGGKIHDHISDTVLRRAFMVVMALSALKMANIISIGSSHGVFTVDEVGSWVGWALLLGGLAGALSVLFGVGGGIIVVPGMAFLLADIHFRTIQVTSLAMIVPTSLSGAFVHTRRGNVLWRSVITLVVPCSAGVFIGVLAAHTMPPQWLKEILFPAFLLLMAVRLGMVKDKSRATASARP